MGICYHCGRALRDAMGRVVEGVELTVDGNVVRAHKRCEAREQGRRPQVTARAVTSEHGSTYVDDVLRVAQDGTIVRRVLPR